MTTVYDNVFTVNERSCCDNDIVTFIYSVDIASSIVTVFLDEGYDQLIECRDSN